MESESGSGITSNSGSESGSGITGARTSRSTATAKKKKKKAKDKKGKKEKKEKKQKAHKKSLHGRQASKRGAPSDLADRKATAADAAREGVCNLFCKQLVMLMKRQKGCGECFADMRCMKADAKLAGPAATRLLKDAEKNHEQLCIIHEKWKEVSGARNGASRIGMFKWARLIEQFDKSQGFRQQLEKEQLTKKEFITRMVAKGMDAEWASGEFQRRLGLPEEYVIDTDPDCGLVRVQAHAGKKDIGFDEYKHSTLIQQGGADTKNPKQVNVQNMVRDALAGGSNFATDSKMSELKAGRAPNVLAMAAASSSATATLDWWNTLDDDDDEGGDAGEGGEVPAKKRRVDPDFDRVHAVHIQKATLQKLVGPQEKDCDAALKEGEATHKYVFLTVVIQFYRL